MMEATMQAHSTEPQVLSVSDGAAAKIAELLAEDESGGSHLRVYVTGGGCSGFQYGFAFEPNPQDDDTCICKNGISLLVDPISLQYLGGAAIDFEEGLEGARFVIRNPNATSSCGCGNSFSV